VGPDLDDALVVDGEDGHHLQRVRRLRPGEVVTAADGEGRWRPYAVEDASSGRIRLGALGPARTEPTLVPGLAVAFALTKGEKPETVVARLTELGVERILLLDSRHAAVRWTPNRVAPALERLRRVARGAALQCRRARLPVVEGPQRVVDLAGQPGLVLADPGGTGPAALPVPTTGGWLAAVGPEGGFAPEELEMLASAPRLALGPHVLRAETAAVAVAAVLATLRHGA
jgi:16S rRNA (uracil1498-N3)-methyltransferase